MISHDITAMVVSAIANKDYKILKKTLRSQEPVSGKIEIAFPKRSQKCIIHFDLLGKSTVFYWRSFLWRKKVIDIVADDALKMNLELIALEQLTPVAIEQNVKERDSISKIENKFRKHFS